MKWIRSHLALVPVGVALGGIAAVIAGTAGDPAVADINPNPATGDLGMGAYTFQDANCVYGDSPTYIEPINVAFVGSLGEDLNVAGHAEHHGGWTHSDGSAQSFDDHRVCRSMHTQRASGPATQLPGRFHMRLRTGTDPNGLQDIEPGFGPFSVADAHHEDVTWCGHVTDHNADNGGRSGFDMGKEDIIKNWVNTGAHPYARSPEWWGNTQPLRQCDGAYSWGDGWTIFVRVGTVPTPTPVPPATATPTPPPPPPPGGGGCGKTPC